MNGQHGLSVGALYDRAVVQGGEHVALKSDTRSLTYTELGRQAHRLLGALQELGLRAGDCVALLMTNCPEYVVCEYALAKAGATRVPLAAMLETEDHVYMTGFVGCRFLIYHQRFADRVRAMAPRLTSVERFICVGDEATESLPGHLDLKAMIDRAPHSGAPAEVGAEDIAGIYFTGGTTGRPKGVMLSHRAWFYTYYVEMLEFGVAWNERFVITTPVTHAGGCLILPVLLRRGCCLLVEHFDPELLLSTIEREQATATLLVPTMIYALLDYPHRGRYDLRSLRNVLYGASAIAPQRLAEALNAFGQIFTQFFGQTEAPMALTVLPRELHRAQDAAYEAAVLGSAGRATYPTEIRLLDDEGRDVPGGEVGEIVARSPNMMSGYYADPHATAATVIDGWLHTGDLARLDEWGNITIVDRKKDMIVSGGYNVFPREVEDVLFEHPAVRQAAVVGVPSEKWGEEVKAVVVLHPGCRVEERELIDLVKARKGSVMAPKSIEFRDEVPLTKLGKVDRKALRDGFWDARERRI